MARESSQMCFACGKNNPISLGLQFEQLAENKVQAHFLPREEHQGYDGLMHGGLVTTLLDEAMVKSISFQGIMALTAEIKVRFKEPVPIGRELLVMGEIGRQKSRLIFTKGSLKDQEGKVYALAEAKFMQV